MEISQKAFSKKEAIRFGWQTLNLHIGLIFKIWGVTLLLGIFSAILGRSFGHGAGDVSTFRLIDLLINIGFYVLNVLITIGILKICLDLVDGKTPALADLFSQGKLFLNFFVASILYGLIVVGGLILLIVPGVIWAIKFQFYRFYIIEGRGPIEALKASAVATKGAKWNLFLFGLLCFLVILLGVVVLLVGLLAAIPTIALAHAWVFRRLSPALPPPSPAAL